jgi:hypothetical protein
MTTRITTENITDATIGTADLASSVPLNTQWQAVVTASSLTAVAGRGYFINTTSNTCTVTLPGSPNIGDTITIVDYASTFATNNVTLNPNGNKIEADTTNGTLSTNDQTHTLVYTDSTQGWKIVNQDTAAGIQPTFVTATGGTVTESGDFKIHSFTGDADFIVSGVSCVSANNEVSYLVVAGGGGGGGCGSDSVGGGGGAGGMRESKSGVDTHTASPLEGATDITVTATTYPITVGGGGANCAPGSNSVFATITSTGGGKGGLRNAGGSGGSGGGGGHEYGGSSGNTPPVSPPQGNDGGTGTNSAPVYPAGGGGGSAEAGNTDGAGHGGDALATSITGSPVEYAAGGGGGVNAGARKVGGGGGGGLGGDPSNPGEDGAANGGHGGGGGLCGGNTAGAGGKGIVIIRYKFQ